MIRNGKDYMAEVKRLPCVLCARLGQEQESPTEAHHIRDGQGMAQRSSDFLTAALCGACHRDGLGIHGDRTLLKIANVSELDLLADTFKAILTA